MAEAVACSGCAARLAVPVGAAGKVLRCPRCGTHNSVPAGEPPPEPEPPRRRRGPEWDDAPLRTKTGGLPGWVWAVGGSFAGAAVLLVVLLAITRRNREQPPPQPGGPPAAEVAAQGKAAETWVSRTHASGAAWEFPTTGESSPTSATVRLPDQKPLTFTVTISDVPPRDKKSAHLHPLTKLRAAEPGKGSGFGPVESTRTIDGRPAVVVRAPNYTAMIAADHDRTYEFTVTTPERDEGGLRAKRFFDSVRFTSPLPSEPAPPSAGVLALGGEAIPPGWDRVQVPRSQMTLLMPKRPPPGGGRAGRDTFDGTIPVARGLVTPDGDDFAVSAGYVEATMLGPNIGDPFGGVKEVRTRTVGGFSARQEYRVVFGQQMVHEVIDLNAGGLKFFYIAITGAELSLDAPEVKRVLDSVSFTLPQKKGPDAPEVLTPPQWNRRFAGGGTFSVEMPGRAKTGVGVALGPATSWAAQGRIPLPGRKHIEFAATALGIAVPNTPNPWRSIETEVKGLGVWGNTMQLVRRVEVGGRPGYISARTDKNGNGVVQMKIQDVVMAYTLSVGGPGVTPDTPAVKRFLESASFTVPPK